MPIETVALHEFSRGLNLPAHVSLKKTRRQKVDLGEPHGPTYSKNWNDASLLSNWHNSKSVLTLDEMEDARWNSFSPRTAQCQSSWVSANHGDVGHNSRRELRSLGKGKKSWVIPAVY